jgi:heptose-I-phosphate ethanolaminephosphotransferase
MIKNKIILFIAGISAYLYPLLLYVFVNIENKRISFFGVLGAFLVALLFILISDYKKKIFFALNIILLIVYNFTILLDIYHIYIFGTALQSSTFLIIFNTNFKESSEFLYSFNDRFITSTLLSTVFFLIFQIFINIKFLKSGFLRFKIKLPLIVVLFLLFSSYKIRSNTILHKISVAFRDYLKEVQFLKESYFDKEGGVFSNVIHSSGEEKEVYVLIIGESTTRNKMSIYDYYRETNPLLEKIEEELFVYKDVISPHTHTIPSLEKILTLATNTNESNRKYDGSIIQLYNKAGFETFWLSNQYPVGIFETQTTLLTKSSHNTTFVNNPSTSNGTYSLDENLFKPLDLALDKKTNKKFIVLHLIGTHLAYDMRYREDFKKFTDIPKTKYNSKKAHRIINDYDNAVLYNDFVVNEIISKVKKTNSKSYVLYVSDHGEDVYESSNKAFHEETEGTKHMYDIPFILWVSKSIKEDKNFVFDVNRPYSSENIIHTLSNLSNINFDQFKPSKSIVNKLFLRKKRVIHNKKTYEETFFEEN